MARAMIYYRMYTTDRRAGVDCNLAYIPEYFHYPHREEFDTDYMRTLFETRYGLAENDLNIEETGNSMRYFFFVFFKQEFPVTLPVSNWHKGEYP